MLSKLLALLMASTLVFMAIGCGSDEDDKDNNEVVLTDMPPPLRQEPPFPVM